MTPSRKEASLSYVLPAAIESIKDGQQRTFQTGAIASSVLAVLSLLTLTFVNASGLLSHDKRDHIRTFLTVVCYGAVFFNLSASVSGFVLIDRLGSLPFNAAQKPSELLPTAGYIEGDSDTLLRRYGAGKLWTLLVLHWFCCFTAGVSCIVLEVVIYLWLTETVVVKVLMLLAGGFTLLPILAFFSPVWRTITGKGL